MSLAFRVLGEVVLAVDGSPAPLRPMERRVLAVLLARHNRPVPAERLVDMVWGTRPPRTAATALRVHVDRLRTAMQKNRVSRLVWSDGTYRLVLEPEELDLCRFEEALRRGRETAARDPATASGVLRRGLQEWVGTPFGEIDGIDVIESTRSYLERRRCELLVELADIELASGRHQQIAADLRRWSDELPDSEALATALVVALYRCGEQVEALEVCRRTVRRFAEDYGLDVGPALRRIEAQVLAQDPALDAPIDAHALGAWSSRSQGAEAPPLGRGELVRRVKRLIAGEGRACVVTLTGPPGIGVSTVLGHLARVVPGAATVGDVTAGDVEGAVVPNGDTTARLIDRLVASSIDTVVVDEGDELTTDRRTALVGAVKAGVLRCVVTGGRCEGLPEQLAAASSSPAAPVVRVEVGELDRAAAAELVRAIIGTGECEASLADEVLAAGGGHPLLLTTLARQALVDGSVLDDVDAVEVLVARWVQTLPEAVRQIILDAAVDPSDVLDVELAAQAAGLTVGVASMAAQAVLDSGFATSRATGLRLRHKVFRAALIQHAQPWGPRHDRLARALTARGHGSPARILHHACRAGDTSVRASAWRWAVQAAQLDEKASSWHEAARHWQMAQDLLGDASGDPAENLRQDTSAHAESLWIRLGHAKALAMAGSLQPAYELAVEVVGSARQAGDFELAARAAVQAVSPWVPTGAVARRCQQMILEALAQPCGQADRIRLIEAGLRASRAGNQELARRFDVLATELTAVIPGADPDLRFVGLRGRLSLSWMRHETPSTRRDLALDMSVLATACADPLLVLEARRALVVASVECADTLGVRHAVDDYVEAAARFGSALHRWLAGELARAHKRRTEGEPLDHQDGEVAFEALIDPDDVMVVRYEQALGQEVRAGTLERLLPLADLVTAGAAGLPGDPMALLASATVARASGRDVPAAVFEPLWEALRGSWRGIPAAALLVLAGGIGNDAEVAAELAPAAGGWVTVTGTGDLGPADAYLALVHARGGALATARVHAAAARRCAETFAPQWLGVVTQMMKGID